MDNEVNKKKELESLLASVFGVSEVKISDVPLGPGSTPVAGLAGLSIKVEKSTHPKCERCWKHLADVGSNPAHLTLCARCAAIVQTDTEFVGGSNG